MVKIHIIGKIVIKVIIINTKFTLFLK